MVNYEFLINCLITSIYPTWQAGLVGRAFQAGRSQAGLRPDFRQPCRQGNHESLKWNLRPLNPRNSSSTDSFALSVPVPHSSSIPYPAAYVSSLRSASSYKCCGRSLILPCTPLVKLKLLKLSLELVYQFLRAFLLSSQLLHHRYVICTLNSRR